MYWGQQESLSCDALCIDFIHSAKVVAKIAWELHLSLVMVLMTLKYKHLILSWLMNRPIIEALMIVENTGSLAFNSVSYSILWAQNMSWKEYLNLINNKWYCQISIHKS